MNPLRVAFFTDSYHEVNGVALTSREFTAFALRRGLPFLSVHPGPETCHRREGACETLEIASSRFVLDLEKDLRFDLAFLRHRRFVRERLEQFRPDLVHVTGPGHTGLLGALLAHDLRVPLAASWHTNLHEYGSRRLRRLQMRLLGVCGGKGAAWAEKKSLAVVLWFYRKAWISFAPNTELVELLASRTGRPCYLMQRGIDSTLFSPQRRTRQDETFVLGYVGRLSPEKNVRQFAALERTLLEAGATDFRFAIVGDGSERGWLAKNLSHADLPGVQRGAELARLYANMDVFVFPSETDTFGNVVLEAQASGVPAVVTDRGGPKFLVDHGVNGFVGADAAGFGEAVLRLYRDRPLLTALKEGARTAALNRRWEPVFEAMYDRYAENHKTVTPDLRVGHRARTVPAVVASRSGCARRRPNMKVKKTVKHVEKAQGLLTAVLEKSDHLPRQVTELLRAATSTIEQAATALAEGDHSRTDDSNRRGAKKAARTRRPRSKAT